MGNENEPDQNGSTDAEQVHLPDPSGDQANAPPLSEAGANSTVTETPLAWQFSKLEPLIERIIATRTEQAAEALSERVLKALHDQRANDTFREKQIDKLHAELQGYKKNLVASAVKPVFQSLIRLHDGMGKLLDAFEKDGFETTTPEKMLRLLRGFQQDVELTLEENGVAVYRGSEERFNANRERVLRTVDTGDQTQVGLIAARMRPGFEQDGTILEKERVAVFVLAAVAATDPVGEKEITS